MKKKLITLIKPLLSIIDNGIFFRKPFSWLYVFFAILSLIAPIYLIYSAINLHVAYESREKSRVKYEVFMQKFEGVKQNYETALKNSNQYTNDIQNAYQNYSQANQNVEYYKNYMQYYPQEYQNAVQQSKQWFSNWKDLEKKSMAAQKEFMTLKPEYDKEIVEYNQLNSEYQISINNYSSKAPQGAFHSSDNGFKSFIGLIFFFIFTIALGWINFLIFWDRRSKLKLINKDSDEFTAIPVLAHFIQTVGEVVGTYIALMGFSIVFIALVFNLCFGIYGLNILFPMGIVNLSNEYQIGIPYLIVPIIVGFLALFLFRIIAEAIKALVIIANNTGNMLMQKSVLYSTDAKEKEETIIELEPENTTL